jgi:CysZ protein
VSPILPLARAFDQLSDPGFLGVLGLSLALAALALVASFLGGTWLLHTGIHAAAGSNTWWPATILGALLAGLFAFFLYVPLATGIAALFSDQIAACVERRWYPGLPQPKGAALTVQAWDGVALGLRVLLAQCVALLGALLLPGIGLLLGWAISAWALGRGLYVTVAMRRATRAAALEDYRRRRGMILLQGAALAALSFLPIINLLVPVLGIAAMVHIALDRPGNES